MSYIHQNITIPSDLKIPSSYKPAFGQYRPHFHPPKNNNNQQITFIDKFLYLLLTLFLWGVLIGIFQGFWVGGVASIYNYITSATIIYLGSFLIIMILILLGQRLKLNKDMENQQSKFVSLITEHEAMTTKK